MSDRGWIKKTLSELKDEVDLLSVLENVIDNVDKELLLLEEIINDKKPISKDDVLLIIENIRKHLQNIK